MWHDDLPPGKSWATLWSGYILCGRCSGIRPLEGPCPACGGAPYGTEPSTIQFTDGREVTVPAAFAGAEGRYEDWIYLQMMEREWKRPVTGAEELIFPDPSSRPSARAALVVLFWSYFETRIERLLRAGMRSVPPRLAEDAMQRYSSIGSRLDRLYRLLFATTYRADLTDLGYDDIGRHLSHVQECRNAFAHGDPRAIDDELVIAVVDNLEREHKAWIDVFNRRGTRRADHAELPQGPLDKAITGG